MAYRSFSPMCDWCVMLTPGLPAASLRTANCLPADRLLLWVSIYLIHITLWSIRQELCRVELNFLPALREAGGWWSLEPRAVAVDVVGHAGEAWAMAADDWDERLIEAAVVGIGGSQTITRRRDTVAQPCEIDRGDPAVVDDEAAADHDTRHRGAVFGMDELVDRVVERQPIRVVEVEHDDVGLVAGGDPPDPVAKAERAGTALGRGQCRLAGRQPAPPIGSLHLGDERGQPHRLVHVLVVGAIRSVGADPEIDPPLQHRPGIGEAAAEPHVAARVVGDRGAAVAEPRHVVLVEPHAVGDGEMRAEHAECLEMGGLGAAIDPYPGHRLDL